ncbi:hypothetical protein GT646_01825 [Clostridium butyricum]|uniref:protein NO VEIN domain-containing protein n=1 Tax=Clostridium butyricum TaxID=1492 RepID=UPI001369CE39|nr:hypothetical protein [Clostridium butyricum]
MEVKASEGDKYTFILTNNEWKTALENEKYIFHFWNLAQNKLYIFYPNEIKGYIPTKGINSKWIKCKITLTKIDTKKFL